MALAALKISTRYQRTLSSNLTFPREETEARFPVTQSCREPAQISQIPGSPLFARRGKERAGTSLPAPSTALGQSPCGNAQPPAFLLGHCQWQPGRTRDVILRQETKQGVFLNPATCLRKKKKKSQQSRDAAESSVPRSSMVKQAGYWVSKRFFFPSHSPGKGASPRPAAPEIPRGAATPLFPAGRKLLLP